MPWLMVKLKNTSFVGKGEGSTKIVFDVKVMVNTDGLSPAVGHADKLRVIVLAAVNGQGITDCCPVHGKARVVRTSGRTSIVVCANVVEHNHTTTKNEANKRVMEQYNIV